MVFSILFTFCLFRIENNLFIFWQVAEDKDVPARVTLLEIPSKNEVRVKNLFNVADCKMHWQKTGDYLCVKVKNIILFFKYRSTNIDIAIRDGIFRNTRQITLMSFWAISDWVLSFFENTWPLLIIALHVMKFLTYLILMRVRSIGLMYFLMIMCYKSIFLYHIKKINFPLLFALGWSLQQIEERKRRPQIRWTLLQLWSFPYERKTNSCWFCGSQGQCSSICLGTHWNQVCHNSWWKPIYDG